MQPNKWALYPLMQANVGSRCEAEVELLGGAGGWGGRGSHYYGGKGAEWKGWPGRRGRASHWPVQIGHEPPAAASAGARPLLGEAPALSGGDGAQPAPLRAAHQYSQADSGGNTEWRRGNLHLRFTSQHQRRSCRWLLSTQGRFQRGRACYVPWVCRRRWGKPVSVSPTVSRIPLSGGNWLLRPAEISARCSHQYFQRCSKCHGLPQRPRPGWYLWGHWHIDVWDFRSAVGLGDRVSVASQRVTMAGRGREITFFQPFLNGEPPVLSRGPEWPGPHHGDPGKVLITEMNFWTFPVFFLGAAPAELGLTNSFWWTLSFFFLFLLTVYLIVWLKFFLKVEPV